MTRTKNAPATSRARYVRLRVLYRYRMPYAVLEVSPDNRRWRRAGWSVFRRLRPGLSVSVGGSTLRFLVPGERP